jgi:hypothetical protein
MSTSGRTGEIFRRSVAPLTHADGACYCAVAAAWVEGCTVERPIEIILFGKAECCLCDEAKGVLRRVAASYPAALREVDILTDPELEVRFREEVPVVYVEGRKAFKFRVPEGELRRRLDRIIGDRRAVPGRPEGAP